MDTESAKVAGSIAQTLRTIALFSPKLAFMLVQGQPLVYRSRSIRVTWDVPTTENVIEGAMFPNQLFQMFWIWNMSYSVRRPGANDGVFGKLEQDYYAQRCPYIDVSMRMVGQENDHLTDGWQPVENVFNPVLNRQNQAWIVTANSNISIDSINRRTFAADELPYYVDYTFSGMELSGCKMPTCGFSDAVCELRRRGILSEED